jgi:hypothetical protein
MQFVQCKFRREDTRSYTYHYEGEDEISIDDEVKVADRSGDGWKRVYVTAIGDEAPSFPTKPILGKIEPEPAEEPAAAPGLDLDADEITF